MSDPVETFEVRVHYPLERGRMVLRCELDWERDLEAVASSDSEARFRVPAPKAFLYFKPVIREGSKLHWSKGPNYLALATEGREVYPYFFADEGCSACELRELAVPGNGRVHRYRVFYPPGYHENVLRRYPVLYMHDGHNLFFPDEASYGRHWEVTETLGVLDQMNALEQVIVVGVHPNEREREYTWPGYEAYGRFLVQALKPAIDASFRTRPEAAATAVMGSSLGGVASLHLAWQWPEVFGQAACLSSTFGWRDDLAERIESQERRAIKLYLDSGWPEDNFEATRAMRGRLRRRGFTEGRDLLYLAFPRARHDERHWALRAHIPLQFFFGAGNAGS